MAQETANIQLFNFDGAEVRTVTKGGEPWFVVSDVCRVLGIANGRDAVSTLSQAMKDGVGIADAIGRTQQMTVVSEAGVYKLAFRSRKPEAERFTDWIASEVLPAIRKTGRYEVARPDWSIPQTFSEALKLAAQQQEALEAQRPLVDFAERVQRSDSAITVDESAKELGIPVVPFRLFVQAYYLFRRHNELWPREEFGPNGRGWFEIKTGTRLHPKTEEDVAFHTVKVTGLGRIKLKEAREKHRTLVTA